MYIVADFAKGETNEEIKANLARATTPLGCDTSLLNIGINSIARLSRGVAGISLSIISEILRHSWTYAFAADTTNDNVELGPLGIRVRVSNQDHTSVLDLHLVAAPMPIDHTGLSTFACFSKVMDVMDPLWRKAIGGATDGARVNLGRVNGFLARVANELMPGKQMIWCAAHQLNRVIDRMGKFLHNPQYQVLQTTDHITCATRALSARETVEACPRRVDV